MSDMIDDNRFVLIEKYKQRLIEGTNISDRQEEMAVIDNILFRFWQMGWLDKLEEETKWISCSERLPETHGAYIVCYSDFRHGIYYGRVIAVAWFDLGDTWLKYRYADNARTFPPKLHHVIAWMPLPKPYKGVTE